MEKYSCYEFEIKLMPEDEQYRDKWVYLIHGQPCAPYDAGIIESEEWYDTNQEAYFAAVGHIDLLENGGKNDA